MTTTSRPLADDLPDDDLAMLLTGADPLTAWTDLAAPEAWVAVTAERSVAVAAAVVTSSRRSRARRVVATRRRRIIAVGLATVVLAPTTAYAAHRFLAQTGAFGKPGMTENDTSEWIQVCASDFPAYVLTLAPSTGALPHGQTWHDLGRDLGPKMQTQAGCPGGSRGSATPGELMQDTGIRSAYLFAAGGLWGCEAVAANGRGEDVAARHAAKEFANTFDAQQALGVFGDDGWRRFRDAGASSDYTVVKQYLDANADCPR